MIIITKACGFAQKLKNIEAKPLRRKRYRKQEFLQQRKKNLESSEKLGIMNDMGTHILQDAMENRPPDIM